MNLHAEGVDALGRCLLSRQDTKELLDVWSLVREKCLSNLVLGDRIGTSKRAKPGTVVLPEFRCETAHAHSQTPRFQVIVSRGLCSLQVVDEPQQLWLVSCCCGSSGETAHARSQTPQFHVCQASFQLL
ncbi:hypothetical protein O3P69_011984 [Scylla paramamosain]|uniref:Uncharacterized protein n=1 Tax=Scylla paramamosain TaxID=85552 RepID=A0AAW0S9F8_SCYPA